MIVHRDPSIGCLIGSRQIELKGVWLFAPAESTSVQLDSLIGDRHLRSSSCSTDPLTTPEMKTSTVSVLAIVASLLFTSAVAIECYVGEYTETAYGERTEVQPREIKDCFGERCFIVIGINKDNFKSTAQRCGNEIVTNRHLCSWDAYHKDISLAEDTTGSAICCSEPLCNKNLETARASWSWSLRNSQKFSNSRGTSSEAFGLKVILSQVQ
uniref:Activin_recp domain-containing protein n=1 Tax=Steinernema glaseri TaxID=37863 RepID=A0A1I7ZDC7_9BILA